MILDVLGIPANHPARLFARRAGRLAFGLVSGLAMAGAFAVAQARDALDR